MKAVLLAVFLASAVTAQDGRGLKPLAQFDGQVLAVNFAERQLVVVVRTGQFGDPAARPELRRHPAVAGLVGINELRCSYFPNESAHEIGDSVQSVISPKGSYVRVAMLGTCPGTLFSVAACTPLWPEGLEQGGDPGGIHAWSPNEKWLASSVPTSPGMVGTGFMVLRLAAAGTAPRDEDEARAVLLPRHKVYALRFLDDTSLLVGAGTLAGDELVWRLYRWIPERGLVTEFGQGSREGRTYLTHWVLSAVIGSSRWPDPIAVHRDTLFFARATEVTLWSLTETASSSAEAKHLDHKARDMSGYEWALFSPNGQRLALGFRETEPAYRLEILDTDSLDVKTTIRYRGLSYDGITPVDAPGRLLGSNRLAAFSPDGTLITVDGQTKVWSTGDGSVVADLPGRVRISSPASFGPGNLLVVETGEKQGALMQVVPR